jgi:hypothetical protein
MHKSHSRSAVKYLRADSSDAAKVKRQSFDKAQDEIFGFAVRSD